MTAPLAFTMGQQASENIGAGMREGSETRALDDILNQAIDNPEMGRDLIGQIIQRVSPERQGNAIKAIEGRIKDISEQRKAVEKENEPALKANETLNQIDKQTKLDIEILTKPFRTGQFGALQLAKGAVRDKFEKDLKDIQVKNAKLRKQAAARFGIKDLEFPQITNEEAEEIMTEAGNDIELAKKIAEARGLSF